MRIHKPSEVVIFHIRWQISHKQQPVAWVELHLHFMFTKHIPIQSRNGRLWRTLVFQSNDGCCTQYSCGCTELLSRNKTNKYSTIYKIIMFTSLQQSTLCSTTALVGTRLHSSYDIQPIQVNERDGRCCNWKAQCGWWKKEIGQRLLTTLEHTSALWPHAHSHSVIEHKA